MINEKYNILITLRDNADDNEDISFLNEAFLIIEQFTTQNRYVGLNKINTFRKDLVGGNPWLLDRCVPMLIGPFVTHSMTPCLKFESISTQHASDTAVCKMSTLLPGP